MKKAIVLLVLFTFVVCLASVASAASPAKIRAYIGLLQRKKAVATKNKNWARVNKLNAMIAVQQKRLAAPAPVVVPPPPPPVTMAPAPAGTLFGWGLDTAGSVGYVMAKSVLNLRGDVVLADPLGLGPIVGLPTESVK